jgi:hypothetical protein
MFIWKNQKKAQSFGLACSLQEKQKVGGVGGHGCMGKWCQSVSCLKIFPCTSNS